MQTQDKKSHVPSSIILHLVFVSIMLFAFFVGFFMFSTEKTSNSFFQRTNFFWVRLLWFETIILVLWYSFTGSYLKKILSERKQTGAINIVTASAYFKLSVYSIIVWLVGCLLPAVGSCQIWVLLVQAGIIIFYVLLLYFLPCMRNLQNDGMESVPIGVKNPDDLVSDLLMLESFVLVNEDEKKAIKRIREKIKYSIPHVGVISNSENYKRLVEEIGNFSKKLSSENPAADIVLFEDRVMKKILMVQHECKK